MFENLILVVISQYDSHRKITHQYLDEMRVGEHGQNIPSPTFDGYHVQLFVPAPSIHQDF